MILYITEGVTRLALRVKEVGDRRQLTDWRELQLLIQPGQYDGEPCDAGGSPWVLHGCWPGKTTGIDIANFRPDFPTIVLNAYELDPDGRVVFRLSQGFQNLPPGRYSGILQVKPKDTGFPFAVAPFASPEHISPEVIIPKGFVFGNQNCLPEQKPGLPPLHRHVCILARFDIDKGPLCSDHLIDQAAISYPTILCEEGA